MNVSLLWEEKSSDEAARCLAVQPGQDGMGAENVRGKGKGNGLALDWGWRLAIPSLRK